MSARTNLQEFLRNKARVTKGPKVDWNKRREFWLEDLDKLYGKIKTWLKPLEAAGDISFSMNPKRIAEDYIGAYDVNKLEIWVGQQKITFDPKGALIAGAEGRVDVMGQKSAKTLIVNKREWSIVEVPRVTYVKVEFLPFTEDSFLWLMKEVME